MLTLLSIETGLIGCSFTFFITGDLLCMHVRIEKIKLRNLLHSDLLNIDKGKGWFFPFSKKI